MSFSIKLVSEDITPKIRGLEARISREVAAELDVVGADIVDLAKSIVPVRTGYLRSTIYHKVEDTNLEVGASAHYAAYVELGTSKMSARPYLRPSVDANREKLLDAVKTGVLKALEG